jgi:hypothetical protein
MIIFIHGMFMTPKCWDHWVSFFKEKGLAGRATAWPEHNKPVHYAFANSMTRPDQGKAYRAYVVPESIRVARDLGKKAVIDFKKAHAPLLLIAGSAVRATGGNIF